LTVINISVCALKEEKFSHLYDCFWHSWIEILALLRMSLSLNFLGVLLFCSFSSVFSSWLFQESFISTENWTICYIIVFLDVPVRTKFLIIVNFCVSFFPFIVEAGRFLSVVLFLLSCTVIKVKYIFGSVK